MPSQPVRGPEQPAAVSDPEPADNATPTESATPVKRAPANKVSPAKKAAPVKKAPTKRAPAKKTTSKPLAVVPEPTTPPPAPEVPKPTPSLVSEAPEEVTPSLVSEVPDEATQLRVVAAVPEPDRRRFESIGEQLLAEPARTPEILAHALVQALGPRAGGWADHVRATYPTASRDALARLAVQRFTRTAGLRGGVGALAGPYTPVALGAATVITHAELVLHLAAVYGRDPADPERAADLLRLASPGAGPVVGWAALSLASPAVRLLTAFLSARTTTEMVAVRARRFYTESPAD